MLDSYEASFRVFLTVIRVARFFFYLYNQSVQEKRRRDSNSRVESREGKGYRVLILRETSASFYVPAILRMNLEFVKTRPFLPVSLDYSSSN